MTRTWQRVSLEGIAVEARVGVADWERHPDRRQRLLVDVEMTRPEWEAPRSLDDCIDYDRVYAHVTSEWPNRPHTDLLETLVDELLELCLRDPKVAWCRVRVRKPDVYNGRAVPVVEAARER